MNCQWLIENFVKESSYAELAEAVERAGKPLTLIRGDYSADMIKHLDGKCVVFNGSIQMCNLIKQAIPNAFSLIYSNFSKYLCQNYYPRFINYLFNDEPVWTTLEQFYRKKWFYYKLLGKEAMIFIRPDSGEKPFTARLLDIQDVDKFYETNKDLSDILVVLASPKNILGEWRLVVSKSEIIAISCYQYHNLVTKVPGAPTNVIEFAETLLKNVPYHPDPVFCYDICQDNDGRPWLLELTSFSSAGLYACNKDIIVQKVSQIAEEEFNNRVL